MTRTKIWSGTRVADAIVLTFISLSFYLDPFISFGSPIIRIAKKCEVGTVNFFLLLKEGVPENV